MGIRILKEGLHTTIQDKGRFGFKSIGVPISGAMDEWSHTLANWMVRNDENAATLECTLIGPELRFEEDSVICLAGKGFKAVVDGRKHSLFQPIWIKKGQTVFIQSEREAARAYLAIQGGLRIPFVLNSQSTFTRGDFGGLNGEALQKGDTLLIHAPYSIPKNRWYLPPTFYESWMKAETIRFVKGNQADWFSKPRYESFVESSYTVSPQSDRMGYRLKGSILKKTVQLELETEGAAVGTIQVPPSGQPIVLMKDGQVTGGYPKIGTVIRADIPLLGQKRPGDVLTFQEVSLEEAIVANRRAKEDLNRLNKRIALQWRDY